MTALTDAERPAIYAAAYAERFGVTPHPAPYGGRNPASSATTTDRTTPTHPEDR